PDPLVPNQMRYQAALCSDRSVSVNVGRILMMDSPCVKRYLKKILKNNAVAYFAYTKRASGMTHKRVAVWSVA
ncbi:hypothetical protein, partial [Reinekea forsetii]